MPTVTTIDFDTPQALEEWLNANIFGGEEVETVCLSKHGFDKVTDEAWEEWTKAMNEPQYMKEMVNQLAVNKFIEIMKHKIFDGEKVIEVKENGEENC